MPFIFGILGFFASSLDLNVEPVRYEAILDDTGQHADAIKDFDLKKRRTTEWIILGPLLSRVGIEGEKLDDLKELHQEKGLEGLSEELDNLPLGGRLQESLKSASPKTIFVEPPASTIEDLNTYIIGEKLLRVDGQDVPLNGVLHIYNEGEDVKADYWSSNVNNDFVKSLGSSYFKARASKQYLSSGDLTQKGLDNARGTALKVKAFDPTKTATNGQSGQAVTGTDKIPFYVAAAAALILWLTIFSGSYMLLTSMLEEKLNKLLEMMLASTRFSEIIFGKLLGVAALTITAMLPYIILGLAVGALLLLGDTPDVASQLFAAFTPKLIVFFFIFLFLGYIFYGAFFVALGALAESMQDAQTLTTPIMLVLTACIMVVPIGLNSPDSPIITFASWFPLSAPFAAIMRLPLDPPWWELALSAFFLFILSIGVIWLAGRIFRFGVLSGAGVKSVTDWIKRVIFRRKA